MATDFRPELATEAKPYLYKVLPDGVLDFWPHEGQARAYFSTARYILMLAGTQGGKTSFGPPWLWNEIGMTADPEGGNDYLAITTSYPLFALKMLPEMRRLFEHTLGIARYWAGARILELKDPRTGSFWASSAQDVMWGRIILLSIGSGGGLEAATAKAAWLDEVGQDEWDLLDWEAVLRRLSLAQGRVLGTTTVYNMGWIKTEWYDKWAEGDPDYDVVQFESILNPAFPREEFDRASRRMDSWRFDMFYRGLFRRPAGLIYSSFSDDLLVDPFPVPAAWQWVGCLDFGGENLAMIHLAQDPKTGVWYACREYLGGGISTKRHVTRVKEEDTDPLALGTITYVGGSGSEEQQRRDWTEEGISVEAPAIQDVEAGISRIIELFLSKRLRVFRNLKGLRGELAAYKRVLGPDLQPTNEIAGKRLYHRLDALRYGGVLIEEGINRGVWRY